MSKKLNIFLTLLLLLLAGGCADDDFKWQGTTVGSDEYLLAFTTPAPEVDVVSGTRATDAERDAITELTLLVFDEQGKLYKDPIHFTPGTDNCKLQDGATPGNVIVKKNQVADGDWYLVANAKNKLSDYIDSKSEVYKDDLLKDITFDRQQLFGDEKHVMIDNASIVLNDEAQAETQVFGLKRLYTRITVEINKDNLPFVMTESRLSRMVETGDLNALPVSTVSNAAVGTDGWVKATGKNWTTGVTFTYAARNEQLPMASYPFKAADGAANNQQIMLMVKGYFNKTNDNTHPEYDASSVCYYAVPLPQLEANHHLKVMINGADAKGKESAAEAEENPGGLSVEFKDNTADIHNIISDGENVLAVPDTIRIKADELTWKFEIMARKAGTTAPTVTVRKVGAAANIWFTMPEDKSGWIVSDNLDVEASKKGLFTTKIEAKGTVKENEGSDRSCKYTIELDGTTLKRDVVFLQEANMNVMYSKAMTITLTIKHSDDTKEFISDYIGFINPGVVETAPAQKCLGIQPENNGGRVRNLGFHAPMPNGGRTQYSYAVRLKDGAKLYRVDSDGNEILEATAPATFNPYYDDDKAYAGGSDKYSYAVQTDRFVVKQGEVEYTLDLYHTGFFHNDGSRWLYYEVIKQDDKPLYWLDRNLGAESAGMGVRNSSVLTSDAWPIMGEDAMGGRYTMEKQEDNYEFSGKCPEGWDVPTYAQMRSMTVSPGFTISRMTTVPDQKTFFAPSFTFNGTENGRPTRIHSYFPQNRMEYDGSINGGDAGAGYYLTTTSAGSEGWYQTMQFSGMNVTSQNTDMKKAKMSVRCCAGSYNPETSTEIYTCNVKGYTHVFMYYLNEDNSKTYLTTWPGDQIAVYSDVDRLHPFKITPTMEYKPERLYVIFNKVKDGVWEEANVSGAKVKARQGIPFKQNGNYDIAASTVADGAVKGDWVTITTPQYKTVGVRWKLENGKTKEKINITDGGNPVNDNKDWNLNWNKDFSAGDGYYLARIIMRESQSAYSFVKKLYFKSNSGDNAEIKYENPDEVKNMLKKVEGNIPYDGIDELYELDVPEGGNQGGGGGNDPDDNYTPAADETVRYLKWNEERGGKVAQMIKIDGCPEGTKAMDGTSITAGSTYTGYVIDNNVRVFKFYIKKSAADNKHSLNFTFMKSDGNARGSSHSVTLQNEWNECWED